MQHRAASTSIAASACALAAWANGQANAARIRLPHGVIQLELSDGNDAAYIEFGASGVTAAAGRTDAATSSLSGPGESLTSVLEGRLDVTHVLASGSGRVSGDYYAALNLSRLALAWRRSGGKGI